MLVEALVVIVISICLHELYAWYQARSLPPGVSGIRCFFELPGKQPWVNVLQFNQRYGDIASASLWGFNVITIGSAKIARDLLDKRGITYADRPRSVMAGELSGWGNVMVLCNYNDLFRTQRKWIARDLGNHTAVARFHSLIEAETRRTLRLVLDEPGMLYSHMNRNFISIMLRLSHGYITKDGSDPFVDSVSSASLQLSDTTKVGAYYVDLIPFLKYIPSWVPGAGFKKTAAKGAAVIHASMEKLHNYTVSQLAAGTALPSLSSDLLAMPGLTEELVKDIKWTTLTLSQGGIGTTSSITYAFYLAMTLYPGVMKKAQQELDSVVGTALLPTFSDRPSLPYMEALFTELLRWQVPAPIAPRRTTVEDVYNGYLIPAGSYVLVNIWAMLRDETMYKNPLEFKPERFLGDNPEPHPDTLCFGFNRRRCPGSYFVHSSVWLMCAQSLAIFDISKHVENGVEVTPEFRQVGGTVANVVPFKCSIKPRSEAAECLVKEAFVI